LALDGSRSPSSPRAKGVEHVARISLYACTMLIETWSGARLFAAVVAAAPANDAPTTPNPPASIVNPSATTCEDIELRVVTESNDPEFSLATLVVGTGKSSLLRRAGDGVGDRTLEFVGYNARRQSPAAWFRKADSDAAKSPEGETCQALLFEPLASRGPPRDAVAPLPAPRPRSRLRVVPEFAGGAVVGIRLLGIDKNGLLGALGLENGDRIEAVNGMDISSPEKALQAYARLRTASDISVRLLRRGRPLTIDYRIR
jgi:general secretion pathway protein C